MKWVQPELCAADIAMSDLRQEVRTSSTPWAHNTDGSDEEALDEDDTEAMNHQLPGDEKRKAVRRLKNRESARRVRARRINEVTELQVQIGELSADNNNLRARMSQVQGHMQSMTARVYELTSKYDAVLAENVTLKAELALRSNAGGSGGLQASTHSQPGREIAAEQDAFAAAPTFKLRQPESILDMAAPVRGSGGWASAAVDGLQSGPPAAVESPLVAQGAPPQPRLGLLAQTPSGQQSQQQQEFLQMLEQASRKAKSERLAALSSQESSSMFDRVDSHCVGAGFDTPHRSRSSSHAPRAPTQPWQLNAMTGDTHSHMSGASRLPQTFSGRTLRIQVPPDAPADPPAHLFSAGRHNRSTSATVASAILRTSQQQQQQQQMQQQQQLQQQMQMQQQQQGGFVPAPRQSSLLLPSSGGSGGNSVLQDLHMLQQHAASAGSGFHLGGHARPTGVAAMAFLNPPLPSSRVFHMPASVTTGGGRPWQDGLGGGLAHAQGHGQGDGSGGGVMSEFEVLMQQHQEHQEQQHLLLQQQLHLQLKQQLQVQQDAALMQLRRHAVGSRNDGGGM